MVRPMVTRIPRVRWWLTRGFGGPGVVVLCPDCGAMVALDRREIAPTAYTHTAIQCGCGWVATAYLEGWKP